MTNHEGSELNSDQLSIPTKLMAIAAQEVLSELNSDQLSIPADLIIPFKIYAEMQLSYITERLKTLAQEINKSDVECINYFWKANEDFQSSNFTPQFLIGYAFVESADVLENISTTSPKGIFNAIFSLGYTYGTVQALIGDEIDRPKLFEQFRSEWGKKSVAKKLANDPKQSAKEEITKEFLLVQSQFKRRGFTAQFVREMADKYPIIESYKTIEKLTTELKKKHPAN